MFGNNRTELRKVFLDSWQKKQQAQPLDAMQNIICHIIELHPEYQSLLKDDNALDKDFPAHAGETNPFLHMSMHIALHEQLSTKRPAGINECHQQLVKNTGSDHEAEHVMMECLGEALWQAQRNQQPPDEAAYLACLQTAAGQKT